MGKRPPRDLRKVDFLVDARVAERVAELKQRLGLMKMSEAWRLVVKKGLEKIEEEAGG